MASRDEDGGYVRAMWLKRLHEIADLDLQRRMWLDAANTNPHWSFIEFVCSYPDEEEINSAQKKGWITQAEASTLKGMAQLIERYVPPRGDDYDHQAILSDPAWFEVSRAAQAATQTLGS
jgi:hypothetical protein